MLIQIYLFNACYIDKFNFSQKKEVLKTSFLKWWKVGVNPTTLWIKIIARNFKYARKYFIKNRINS